MAEAQLLVEGPKSELSLDLDADSTVKFAELISQALDGDRAAAVQAISEADRRNSPYIVTVLEVVAREGMNEEDARRVFEEHPTLFSGPDDVVRQLGLAVTRGDLRKEGSRYKPSETIGEAGSSGLGMLLAFGAAALGVMFLARRLAR